MKVYLNKKEIKKIINVLGEDDPLSKRLKKKNAIKKGPKADLSSLADKWHSDIVYRKDMNAFTGGVIGPKSMENFDWRRKGPAGGLMIGNKKAYRIKPLIEWLENRSEVLS